MQDFQNSREREPGREWCVKRQILFSQACLQWLVGLRVAAQQAARTVLWIGTDDTVEEQRLQAEHQSTMPADSKLSTGWIRKNILELALRGNARQENQGPGRLVAR